jgi:hypothetical protein
MRCAEFRRWLDEGRDAHGAAPAAAHASTCAACGALERAEAAIERWLAEELEPAPAGFTERLMSRLETPRAVLAPLRKPEIPWWLRAAVDPAAVLALALAGLVSWRGSSLWAAGLVAGEASGRWLTEVFASASRATYVSPALDWLSRPGIGLGLEIALACMSLLAAPALTRWVLRAATRAAAS